MPQENFSEKIIDVGLQGNEWLEKATKNVVSATKDTYFKIMNSYCHWLDVKGVSPNMVVTGRVVAGTVTGGILASGDLGTTAEVAGVSILGLTFIHDAVDGHLARITKQTSSDGETLDALGDKIKVFILLSILLITMDVNPVIFTGLIGATGIALLLDIKSQLLRTNNIEALKKCMKLPLSDKERKSNPNTKSSGAAVSAGKIKTGIIMSGVTLGFMEDIPGFEWSDDNSIALLIALVGSNIAAIKSLRDKGVSFQKFFPLKSSE